MEPQDTIHCNVYMCAIEYLHMFPYMNQLKAKTFICECVNFESGQKVIFMTSQCHNCNLSNLWLWFDYCIIMNLTQLCLYF